MNIWFSENSETKIWQDNKKHILDTTVIIGAASTREGGEATITLLAQARVEGGGSLSASGGGLSLLIHRLVLQVPLDRVVTHKECLVVELYGTAPHLVSIGPHHLGEKGGGEV